MKIEQFVAQSIGEWRTMRSSHSLAFKQFEEVISTIKITAIEIESKEVRDLANIYLHDSLDIRCPFEITWEAESNWEDDHNLGNNAGSCVLVPIPK